MSLGIVACDSESAAPDRSDNSYVTDRATGETRARIETHGGPATMVSGSNVVPSLPAAFTLPADAEIDEVTNIARAGGRSTLIWFSTEDSPEAVAARFRDQFSEAGFAIHTDLAAPKRTTLSGSRPPDGRFTLSARRADGTTLAELSLRHGLAGTDAAR